MVKCSKSQIRKLKTALRWKIPAAQRQRIQMVLLRESGMTQPAIAAAMGVSLSTVNRAHMDFDHGGIKALKPKPIGGRQRENMTLAGEKALLACFAKAAGAGEMLNIHDLKAAYEQAIGHPTSCWTPAARPLSPRLGSPPSQPDFLENGETLNEPGQRPAIIRDLDHICAPAAPSLMAMVVPTSPGDHGGAEAGTVALWGRAVQLNTRGGRNASQNRQLT